MRFLLSQAGGSVASTIWNHIVESLSLAQNIWAIVFAILGITISVLAKRITRIIRNNNEISDNDTVLILLKAIGLGFIFVALMFVVLGYFV